jgi:hypothetical protein
MGTGWLSGTVSRIAQPEMAKDSRRDRRLVLGKHQASASLSQ